MSWTSRQNYLPPMRSSGQHSRVFLRAHADSRRADVGRAQPDIWYPLRRMWTLLSAAHCAMVSEEDAAQDGDAHETVLRNFAVSLARFTRNLVAAVTANQERALSATVSFYVPRSSTEPAALRTTVRTNPTFGRSCGITPPTRCFRTQNVNAHSLVPNETAR